MHALRYAGAAALLGVGAGHLQQLIVDHYDAVPTIGTLFELNVVSATLVGLALLAPLQRLPGRAAQRAPLVFAAGGVAIATGSLLALSGSARPRPCSGSWRSDSARPSPCSSGSRSPPPCSRRTS